MNGSPLVRLLDLAAVQHLLEAYAQLIGMTVRLFADDHTLLCSAGAQELCPSCRRAQGAAGQSHCLSLPGGGSHQGIWTEDPCGNGMVTAALPITIEGALAGTLRLGPFCVEDASPTSPAAEACASGHAMGRIPVFSRAYVDRVMLFLEHFVGLLVRQGLDNAGLVRKMEEHRQVEEALAISEQQFRTLTENSPDHIARYDRAGRRLYLNPALMRLFSLPSEKVLGRRPTEHSPLLNAGQYEQLVHQVFRSKRQIQTELQFRPPLGEPIFSLVTFVPEFNAAGTVESVLAIGRDISELKKAEQGLRASEQQLRTLAETLPGVIYTFQVGADGTWSMPYISPRIVELNGLRPETIIADFFRIVDRVHPEDADQTLASLSKAVAACSPWSCEFRWQHPLKGDVWVEGRSTPVRQPDGSILWFGFFHDITEQKSLEQALFAAKRMEIIGQLASGVAHEVRNPLNAILSISEALFKEQELAGNEKFSPYIDHVRTQIHRLSKLMTDLLDLGKPIKADNFRPIRLDQLCADTIGLWKLINGTSDYELALVNELAAGEVPWVRGDSMRLQQALLNLIDNSAQSSCKGQAIELRIAEAGDRRLALRVRDSGTGVAEPLTEQLFEPFFTLRPEGTGLGLSLVKHFVESMGGAIRIRNNEPPPGCTAELLLLRTNEQEYAHET